MSSGSKSVLRNGCICIHGKVIVTVVHYVEVSAKSVRFIISINILIIMRFRMKDNGFIMHAHVSCLSNSHVATYTGILKIKCIRHQSQPKNNNNNNNIASVCYVISVSSILYHLMICLYRCLYRT